MNNNILKYKGNIIYCLIILFVLILFISLYSGVKEGYFNIFIIASILSPFILIIKPKNKLYEDFIFAIFIVLAISIYAVAFWKYQDRLPPYVTDISQIPEEARGQFGFENELNLNLLFICSTISMAAASLIRLIMKRLKINYS